MCRVRVRSVPRLLARYISRLLGIQANYFERSGVFEKENAFFNRDSAES